jgi:hypothetical protein
LLGRFRKTFQVDYSFNQFFAGPTIRDMVAYLGLAGPRCEEVA